MMKWLSLLLVVGLLVGGCASARTADTPTNQTLLEVGERLKVLSASYKDTNERYVSQCKARILDVATCNAWNIYTTEFTSEYTKLDMDWRAARAYPAMGGAILQERVIALSDKLATYTARTK